jgi:hypothetical protein
MNAIDESVRDEGRNVPACLTLGTTPSGDESLDGTWDEDGAGIGPEGTAPADRDGSLQTSQAHPRRGEDPCDVTSPDEPAILCARIRELARSCHALVLRAGRKLDPPTLSEIDEVLTRLLRLRHHLRRIRALHGLPTGELDRWAGNLFRAVAVLEAGSRPGRSSGDSRGGVV